MLPSGVMHATSLRSSRAIRALRGTLIMVGDDPHRKTLRLIMKLSYRGRGAVLHYAHGRILLRVRSSLIHNASIRPD